MPSKFKCCVKNCKGGEKRFRFLPTNKEKWCEILKIDLSEVNETYRVCELHFDSSVIGATRLLQGAMPTKMLGHNCDPINLDETCKSTEVLQVQTNCDYEQHLIIDKQQVLVQQQPIVLRVEPEQRQQQLIDERSRQSRINDLHQQEELILFLEDRSPVTQREEQRRRVFIRNQKARVLRQLRELGAESVLLQQFLSKSSRKNQ